jgi:hypothetical protein
MRGHGDLPSVWYYILYYISKVIVTSWSEMVGDIFGEVAHIANHVIRMVKWKAVKMGS